MLSALPLKAEKVAFFTKTWRVYFRPRMLKVKSHRAAMHEWCRENASGKYLMQTSHVRFSDESDALLCFLSWQ